MDIKLITLAEDNVTVLSGREEGKKNREYYNLDLTDKMDEVIVYIQADNKLRSLNASYFMGMFAKSVRTLGKVAFNDKYRFYCSPTIRNNIDDGILQALNTSDEVDEPPTFDTKAKQLAYIVSNEILKQHGYFNADDILSLVKDKIPSLSNKPSTDTDLRSLIRKHIKTMSELGLIGGTTLRHYVIERI